MPAPATLTELVFILDRSGSMTGLENDTIGGFNGTIASQREEPGEVLVTTVLFDHLYEVLYDRLPIGKIPKMTRAQYFTRGSTALLDAVGRTIEGIRTQQKAYAAVDCIVRSARYNMAPSGAWKEDVEKDTAERGGR